MTITPGGSVGIGTSTPAAALDIEGGTPGLKVGATCVSGTCPSDRRLKQNIRYLHRALTIVEKLKPAAFKYKAEPGSEVGYGLIAQDVQAVAPELVRRGKDGFLRVNYSPLEMMLIQATKELNRENRALQERLERIEARLERRQDR